MIATGHALSLALLEGGELLAQSHDELERGHAEALMPAIERLLAPFGGSGAQVGEIIVETGPGSFTGLRIGLATARALGVAWGVPVHGVRSTRLVLAEARAGGVEGPVLVALAAPRGQIWSEFFSAENESAGEPVARQADQARAALLPGEQVAGSAAAILGAAIPGAEIPAAGQSGQPRAAAWRWLAGDSPEPPVLLYVRQAES